jgi:hypothetical protein
MSFFLKDTLKALAHAVEFYLVHYIWDKLGEMDNAAAAEEYSQLSEIINTLDLKRFFDSSTLMRF